MILFSIVPLGSYIFLFSLLIPYHSRYLAWTSREKVRIREESVLTTTELSLNHGRVVEGGEVIKRPQLLIPNDYSDLFLLPQKISVLIMLFKDPLYYSLSPSCPSLGECVSYSILPKCCHI